MPVVREGEYISAEIDERDASLSMRDHSVALVVVVASLLAMEYADKGSEVDAPVLASMLSGTARASHFEIRVD